MKSENSPSPRDCPFMFRGCEQVKGLSPNGERVRARGLNCNLCGSSQYKIVYTKDLNHNQEHSKGYAITQGLTSQPNQIVKCLDCGLVYALSIEERDSLLKEYKGMKDELYISEGHSRRQTARRVLTEISRFKVQGRLLEVGSACGFFLDEARKLGWEVTGLEPSRWAAGYARSNFGLNVIEGSLEDVNLPRGYFDIVVMADVLEHITDAKSALEKIRQLLKDDGLLYISTPDINSLASRFLKDKWWGIKKHHLYYFSRETLKALLAKTGFELVRSSYYCRHFSIGYLLRLSNPYSKRIANALKGFLKRTSLENKEISLNLYDQMAIFAKKRPLLND